MTSEAGEMVLREMSFIFAQLARAIRGCVTDPYAIGFIKGNSLSQSFVKMS